MAPILSRSGRPNSSERITFTIRLWDESNSVIIRDDSSFSLKTCSSLKTIFRIFIARECPIENCFGFFRFSFGDKILFGEESPIDLSLNDGDVIDAVPNGPLGSSQFV